MTAHKKSWRANPVRRGPQLSCRCGGGGASPCASAAPHSTVKTRSLFYGVIFSAFVRPCMIEELAKRGA